MSEPELVQRDDGSGIGSYLGEADFGDGEGEEERECEEVQCERGVGVCGNRHCCF